MLSIYTRTNNPFTKEFWKYVESRHILRRKRGPEAVRDSLVRGLCSLQTSFALNPLLPQGNTALVLSGTRALRDAIMMKRMGKIRRIIAGPNIVAHPRDAGFIMNDPTIDIILVPAQWVADLWIHEAPELAAKIRVWFAGVAIISASTRSGSPIIYDKLGDTALLSRIQSAVEGNSHTFTYGSFSQKNYLEALQTAPYLIYLAQSESQGLALQEAWAHDVPTLVNTSTHWESNGVSWNAPQINAPYLTPELGVIFQAFDELPTLIAQSQTLHPKRYCDTHLSDEASARILLDIT